MLPIHSDTSRAYWRVVILRSGPRRPVNKNSPGLLLAAFKQSSMACRVCSLNIQTGPAVQFSFAGRSRGRPYIHRRRHLRPEEQRHHNHEACYRLPGCTWLGRERGPRSGASSGSTRRAWVAAAALRRLQRAKSDRRNRELNQDRFEQRRTLEADLAAGAV